MSEPQDVQPDDADFEAWLAARPESVQKLAKEFPRGHEIKLDDDVTLYVIGWTEDDWLVVSECMKSTADRQYICASHLRDGDVLVQVSDSKPTEPDAA